MARIALPVAGAALLLLAGCNIGEHAASADKTPARSVRTVCLASAPRAEPAPSRAGMVFIQGGVFTMGGEALQPEEGPPRRTHISPFWIDRTDVTNAEFARFIAATGYVTEAERRLDPKAYPGLPAAALAPSAIVFVGSEQRPGSDPSAWWRVVQGANWRRPEGPGSSIAGRDQRPVVQVGYEDALAYARWLGHDLPTEAEWEFAARGGKPAGRYVWGDAPFDPKRPQANVWQGVFPVIDTGEDGYKIQASPVGCFPPNGYGLYDMAGDVWQWTKDWYRPNLDPEDRVNPAGPSASRAADPRDPGERRHVIKGGSFLCSPDYCFRYRPPAREAGPSDTGENHIGFRTVLRSAAP